MRKKRRLSALLLTLLLCCVMAVNVYAREIPDLFRTGSISFAMTYDGKSVSGGSLMIYRAGNVRTEDGDYRFVLSDEFAASGVSLKDPADEETAEKLAQYAAASQVAGTEIVISENGEAVVGGLTPGLYLVTQSKAADGLEAVVPFLVSVPMYENGTYVYAVDASPKMEPLKRTSTPTPAAPAAPETRLPQTGQLNWPVPVLTILGLILFFAGWRLRFGGQRMIYGA